MWATIPRPQRSRPTGSATAAITTRSIEGPVYGIVLDSNLLKSLGKVAAEAAAQEKFLEAELAKAAAAGKMRQHFQHIPLFLEKPDEPEQYFNLPVETRARILKLLHRFGVHYVFAGHGDNSYGDAFAYW